MPDKVIVRPSIDPADPDRERVARPDATHAVTADAVGTWRRGDLISAADLPNSKDGLDRLVKLGAVREIEADERDGLKAYGLASYPLNPVPSDEPVKGGEHNPAVVVTRPDGTDVKVDRSDLAAPAPEPKKPAPKADDLTKPPAPAPDKAK